MTKNLADFGLNKPIQIKKKHIFGILICNPMPQLTKILVSLSLFSLVSLHTQGQSSVFSFDSFDQAQVFSMQEGKPLMAFFTADWIMPCQWMEEHTFSEENIKKILRESYTAVRIDIDEASGKAVKQRFGVTKLPSVLLFDEKGSLRKTIEQSINAATLGEELENFLHTGTNTPMAAQIEAAEPTLEAPRPILTISRPAIIPEQQISKPTAAPESGIAEFIPPIPEKRKWYGIQVGSYSDYDNALKASRKIAGYSELSVSIHQSNPNEAYSFKVLIGSFTDPDEAFQELRQLKRYKLEGFVREIP